MGDLKPRCADPGISVQFAHTMYYLEFLGVLLMNNIQNFRKNSPFLPDPVITQCIRLSYRNRGSDSLKTNTSVKRKMNGVEISLQAKYFIVDIQLNCEHCIWCCPRGL